MLFHCNKSSSLPGHINIPLLQWKGQITHVVALLLFIKSKYDKCLSASSLPFLSLSCSSSLLFVFSAILFLPDSPIFFLCLQSVMISLVRLHCLKNFASAHICLLCCFPASRFHTPLSVFCVALFLHSDAKFPSLTPIFLFQLRAPAKEHVDNLVFTLNRRFF